MATKKRKSKKQKAVVKRNDTLYAIPKSARIKNIVDLLVAQNIINSGLIKEQTEQCESWQEPMLIFMERALLLRANKDFSVESNKD